MRRLNLLLPVDYLTRLAREFVSRRLILNKIKGRYLQHLAWLATLNCIDYIDLSVFYLIFILTLKTIQRVIIIYIIFFKLYAYSGISLMIKLTLFT